MSDTKEYVFEVETKEAGQRRRYGDSYYHYIVKSKLSLQSVKRFCTEILRPAMPAKQYKEEESLSFDNHFRQYYTKLEVLKESNFVDYLADEDDGYNIVEYKVISPSTH